MAADGLHLEEDPAEQALLARMRRMQAAGLTHRQIAEDLNQRGFITRRGTAWRRQYMTAALAA
jgi:hypothetical protein